MKVSYPYSSQQKIRDVTNEREDIVKAMSKSMNDIVVNVYECKGTVIIFSQNNVSKHVSISNISRPVNEGEAGYAIARILKIKTRDVSIYITESDVVHIHYEKDSTLTN